MEEATHIREAITVAAEFAMLPALLWRLVGEHGSGVKEAGLDVELRAAAEHVAAQNACLLADLADASSLLSSAGIASVALKGAALIAADYPAPWARHVDDIDLLVREVDARRAHRALREAGYREPEFWDRVAVDGRPMRDHYWRNHRHLMGLLSPRGTPVELHVRTPASDRGTEEFDVVHGAAREVEVAGATVRVASRVELVSQLCLHVVLAHGLEARLVPRHLSDLDVLLGDAAWSAGSPVAGLGRRAQGCLRISQILGGAAERERLGQERPVDRALAGWVYAPALARSAWSTADRVRAFVGRVTRDALFHRSLLARRFVPHRSYLEQEFGPAARSESTARLAARRLLRKVAGDGRGGAR